MTKTKQRRATSVVEKPAQIRVLASTARQDVLETVEARGRCTIRELARCLRRRPDALYYHLRVLQRAGFLDVVREEGESVLSVRRRAVQLEYEPENARNRAAVLAVVAAMVRGSERGFERGFNSRATVSGPARNLWAGRVKGSLTKDQLATINELIESLLAEFQSRGGQGEMVELTFLMNPA